MLSFRKCPAWLMLASYLFASSAAAQFHDHHQCSGDSEAAHHHSDGAISTDDHDEGDEHDSSDKCVVCKFLAQAPLAPASIELVPAGDILPDEVSLAILPRATAVFTTHPARGPPAV
jgi:hypothetical protein